MRTQRYLAVILTLSAIFASPAAWADESSIFTNIAPDAMFMIDFSGSMGWNPPGDTTVSVYGDSICAGPFTTAGGSTDCKRLSIAKRAMFGLLDDNADGKVDCYDKNSLNVNVGYMGFRGTEDTAVDPLTGNASVRWPIGTDYHKMYCNANTGCGTLSTYMCSTWNYGYGATLAMESAGGGTPLNWALKEMKSYLDTHKAADAAKSCRQKFVILLSDGVDTYSCAGTGSEGQTDMYKRRRLSVQRAKLLGDAGYRVFVIGFGQNMPASLKNTLNWMAYYGGTDNPLELNQGDTSAYDPTLNAECEVASTTGTCNGTSTECYGSTNDPGNIPLSGYAFISGNSTELKLALKQAMELIRESNYSFSTATVASARTLAENYLYEASFQPINSDPFWQGHLRKYQLNEDGSIAGILWDAGNVLQSTAAASRTIKTLKGGVLTDFTTANIAPVDLALTSTDTASRDMIVGFVRGDTTNNKENWKLGDIFRSAPVSVGSPSAYYADSRDTATPNAFSAFRSAHPRSTANGLRVILAGANDGQLHAFRADTGAEVWSIIPPNLRSKLKNIAHKTHPAGLSHQYFVDGPISVSDAWLGSGDGTAKVSSDWKTLLVLGEGRGSTSYLWSSSATCDSDFINSYKDDGSYPYYCGYWAFEITNTYSPAYKWKITPSAAQAPYLGDPWSKMHMSRVRIGSNEQWVGFMGGGHNLSNLTLCAANGPNYGDCDKRGKGLFAINLSNGNVLWGATHLANAGMEYAFPASMALLDSDGDGFVDTAYVGDLGGNMWRLRFCQQVVSGSSDPLQSASCSSSNWTATKLFDGTASSLSARPIYNIVATAPDGAGNLWVYWGTGDKVNNTDTTTRDIFVALKDTDQSSTRTLSNLQDVSGSSAYYNDSTKFGWYIALPAGTGEKILSAPAVFGGSAWFTTWVPPSSADPCSQVGTSKLYSVDYTSGGGSLPDGSGGKVKSASLGAGMAIGPTFSLNPGGGSEMYITQSGNDGSYVPPPGPGPSGCLGNSCYSTGPGGSGGNNRIIYWKDSRVN
ncbi:MAG TPA: PilC/PilY family type IV pilus protein [Syntrophales bacterium]|nr:PilC/PilY family type IV pilus protein [Syntrophales bacterium]